MNRNSTAAFIIPYFAGKDHRESMVFLQQAIEGIRRQTDSDWHIILVEDGSGNVEAEKQLNSLKEKLGNQITIHFNRENLGSGESRNVAIRIAYERQYPFIIFNDADDISHPKRVEVVRQIFDSDADAAVLYSTFSVIDESSILVPDEQLAPSIKAILDGHKNGPVEGYDVWQKMGYFNLTSATSVRTELAMKAQFPKENVSEDVVTWMRYSALGGKFVFTPLIPSLYRVPSYAEGSSSRSREGGKEAFFSQVARVNAMGYKECVDICLKQKRITDEQAKQLMVEFYIKLGAILGYENLEELAKNQVSKAREVSAGIAKQVIKDLDLEQFAWMQ